MLAHFQEFMVIHMLIKEQQVMFLQGQKWEEMGKVFDTAPNNAHEDAHGNFLCLRFFSL